MKHGGRESMTPTDAVRLNLIGESDAFRKTTSLIQRLSEFDATTLVVGETGTGKEIAARAIHYLSPRRNFPFIPVHCGALPDNLLESELFGYEKGAFTDAKERRSGLVSEANGGTLFLDEVEAMTPRSQIVLLRFLQDQKYRAVGGRTLSTANVRIIAATNASLPDMVDQALFRQDLWFRLRILELTLPPLRERRGDPVLLARHFLNRFSEAYARPPRRLHPATIEWLDQYSWPGNVRELESLILRELLLGEGDEIRVHSVSDRRTVPPSRPSSAPFNPVFKRAKAEAVADFERGYLATLLASTQGNISHAARLARKDRSALTKLAKKHGLLLKSFRANSNAARNPR